jgi:hypothetical protein
MHTRASRRALALATIPIVALFTVVFGVATAASAHDVSGITASCNDVTVHFVDFPEEGVVVHIAATVEGHATLSSDAVVKSDMTTKVNIASATSTLAGATAAVNVDVTWTFQGAQHVHATLHVTCGETHHCGCATTTTTHATTTTTTAKATSTTTTIAGGTVTTEPAGGSTSSTVGGSTDTTSTSVSAEVVTGSNGSGSGDNGVVGATATNGGITPTANRTGSLPFTGTATVPLLILGLASVGAGSAMVIRSRKRQRLTGS